MTRASQALILSNGTVISDPAAEPVPERTVVVTGETIMAVRPAGGAELSGDAQVLDCIGCTIVAGFWNCHVHFFERKWANASSLPFEELAKQLEDFARFGFTTVTTYRRRGKTPHSWRDGHADARSRRCGCRPA